MWNVRETVQDTGRIDIFVNNAGILRDRVLWKLTDEGWDHVLAGYTPAAPSA